MSRVFIDEFIVYNYKRLEFIVYGWVIRVAIFRIPL
jgi:hypothetical protein